jgi:flavin reductase (DIM6/NTAB) family NADH-FMN oxidoreductase RutF
MEEYPLDRAFEFLEPGPVVLVSTSRKGRHNLMTMSWHMVVDFTPRIACIIGPWDYSFEALKATGQCVLAVPGADLLDKVVDIGNCSGRDVDKFAKFRLTPVPAAKVKAPLVAQCLANIECRVADESLVEEHGLFLLQGVRAWIEPGRKEQRAFHAHGDGTFSLEGRRLDRRARMTKWQSVI